MRRLRYIFLTVLSVLILLPAASCRKQDMLLTIADQEESIGRYIANEFPDSPVVRHKGSNRIILQEGNPEILLEEGDTLCFHYAGYLFDGRPTRLFSTNVKEVAESGGFALTDPDYSVRKMVYAPGIFMEGLENGLYHIAEREHAVILFSARYGFFNKVVYNIPKLSAMVFEIWIDEIIKR